MILPLVFGLILYPANKAGTPKGLYPDNASYCKTAGARSQGPRLPAAPEKALHAPIGKALRAEEFLLYVFNGEASLSQAHIHSFNTA